MIYARSVFLTVALLLILVSSLSAQPATEEGERAVLISGRIVDSRYKLYVLPENGEDPELFIDLSEYGQITNGALSPDNQKLAFIGLEDETWLKTLAILELETGEVTEIRTDLAHMGDLNWSPDSSYLTYLGDGIGPYGSVYRYDMTTHEDHKLEWWATLQSAAKFDGIRNMEQSSDGEKFIFSVVTLPPEAELFFIVIDADGSNAKQIPLTRYSISPFTWNSTSDAVYFVCVPNDASYLSIIEICSIDLAIGETETLISAAQLETIRPGLSDSGVHKLALDGDELLAEFLSVVVIYNLQNHTFIKLLEDMNYSLDVLGWIDSSEKE